MKSALEMKNLDREHKATDNNGPKEQKNKARPEK